MKRVGSRLQVMRGTAKQTGGGLRKRDLKYNKHGKIVSKKVSTIAKKNLKKGGYKIKNMIGGGEYDISYQMDDTSKWINGKLEITYNGPILNEEYSISIGGHRIYFHNTDINMDPPRKMLGMSRKYRVNIIDISKTPNKIIKIAFNDSTKKQLFINEFLDTVTRIKQMHRNYNTAAAASNPNQNNMNRAIAASIVTSNREDHRRASARASARAAQVEKNGNLAKRLQAKEDLRRAASNSNMNRAIAASIVTSNREDHRRAAARRAAAADTTGVTANNSGLRSMEKAMASTLEKNKATKHLRSESYLPKGTYVYLYNKQSYGNLYEYKPYGNDDPQRRFIRDVRADGSCFFRAIILGLLELCWDKEAFLRTIIEKIIEISQKDQYNQRVNYELLLSFLNKFVLNYIYTHGFVEYSKIICTELNENRSEIMSKHFILFIKLLVVNCNKPIYLEQKKILTSVEFENTHFANQIIDHYFVPTTFNTQTDIIAIREEFTININVYQYNSEERDPNRRTYKSANSSYNGIKPTISLFYTGHHYMMLYDNRAVTARSNAATARPAYSNRQEKLIRERRRVIKKRKEEEIFKRVKTFFSNSSNSFTNEDIKSKISSINNNKLITMSNNVNQLTELVINKLLNPE